MVVRSKSYLLSCVTASLLLMSSAAEAQSRYASKERSHSAVAHYARARAMCVETLEEFEAGRRFARPDLLLDAEEWRLTLVSLCEKLNRLVDPKIRISSQGIQVASNPRMVRRMKDRLPAVQDGPEPRNDVGEQKRLLEKQEARARLYTPTRSPEVPQQPAVTRVVPQPKAVEIPQREEPAVDQQTEVSEAPAMEDSLPKQPEDEAAPSEEELLEQALEEAAAIAEQDVARNTAAEAPDLAEPEMAEPELEEQELLEDDAAPQTEVAEIPPPDAEPPLEDRASLGAADERGELSQDEAIAIAIEQTIQDKLRNLEGGSRPDEVEEDLE